MRYSVCGRCKVFASYIRVYGSEALAGFEDCMIEILLCVSTVPPLRVRIWGGRLIN